jgi:ribosome biogenesis GTPase
MILESYGFDRSLLQYVVRLEDPELEPARVVRADRDLCQVVGEWGESLAHPTGRFLTDIASVNAGGPVTGDFVACRRAGPEMVLMEALLPRKTVLCRSAPQGAGGIQPLAANVDLVFLCEPFPDPNMRRLERGVVLAAEAGATAVVLLTKSDLQTDPAAARSEALDRLCGIETLCVSSHTASGLDAIGALLMPNLTGVLIGPSGAGKSSLVNALAGQVRQAVGEVREFDRKGRHTTTSRELFRLPAGGLLLDTPGLREVGVFGRVGLEAAFEDVSGLASGCRFRNCAHDGEPGCAVRAAVESGELPGSRIVLYLELVKEARAAERRKSPHLQRRIQRRTHKIYRKGARDKRRLRGLEE